MGSPAYSERFLVVPGDGQRHEVQIPNGYRAIVKNVLVANSDTLDALVYLILGPDVLWFRRVPGQTGWVETSWNLVYYANAHIACIVTNAPAARCTISGYLVRATEPSPLPPQTSRPPLEFATELPS